MCVAAVVWCVSCLPQGAAVLTLNMHGTCYVLCFALDADVPPQSLPEHPDGPLEVCEHCAHKLSEHATPGHGLGNDNDGNEVRHAGADISGQQREDPCSARCTCRGRGT